MRRIHRIGEASSNSLHRPPELHTRTSGLVSIFPFPSALIDLLSSLLRLHLVPFYSLWIAHRLTPKRLLPSSFIHLIRKVFVLAPCTFTSVAFFTTPDRQTLILTSCILRRHYSHPQVQASVLPLNRLPRTFSLSTICTHSPSSW